MVSFGSEKGFQRSGRGYRGRSSRAGGRWWQSCFGGVSSGTYDTMRSADCRRARRWVLVAVAVVVGGTNLGNIKAAVRTGGSFVEANGCRSWVEEGGCTASVGAKGVREGAGDEEEEEEANTKKPSSVSE